MGQWTPPTNLSASATIGRSVESKDQQYHLNYFTYPIVEPLVTLTMLIPTEFWDSYGGLSFGLFAGYIFEIFENSDYIINT